MSQDQLNPQVPLRSVFTTSLAEVLKQLNISLAVSTYQAGKVVLVRCDADGATAENPAGVVNTHFRSFDRPMGLAVNANRLSIGGANTVWELRNQPGVAAKLDPPGKHDACYLPRSIHITGDIDIHEMAWSSDNELWLVNTKFCCLCTLDIDHSFSPRWRPPFVSALAPEDRCHLNGLAMVDGRPKYVTALGETDAEGGWRANKANGGILMDIDSNDIVLRGLSMPHSPRWYNDKLWILESGEGALATVDPENGTWQTVAVVPGFTRGIDFIGPLAFIGLSKVRESATFSGIPIVSRLKERTCGVWVVNIETGATVAFLRFESGVEEIFAVQILPAGYPEMLEWGNPHIASSYVLPDEALADVVLPTEQELARSPAAQFKLGLQLYRNAKLPGAIAAFRKCVALQPDFPNARLSLGIALLDNEDYDEAARHLEQVVAAEHEQMQAHNSLGLVYIHQHRFDEAVTCFERAIDLKADYSEAHYNLGVTLLQGGNYGRGLVEYEWRWKLPQFAPLQCPQPQWNGAEISDQALLLHAEQGAGDAIQYARYIPLAAQRCGKLILVCQADLSPVLAAMPGIRKICQPGQVDVSEFDTWLPLTSLPRVFGTTPDNIPADIPYINAERISRRKDISALRLPDTAQTRVGIVWSTKQTGKDDRHRSCPLTEFLPLIETPGIEFYSLQTGPQRDELSGLPDSISLHDLGEKPDDYGDMVIILTQLDLVITVDTAVAHLAGALGTPVWLLLNTLPDWRWGLQGDTTPWYPGMRLARQNKPEDWSEPMTQVKKALQHLSQGAPEA